MKQEMKPGFTQIPNIVIDDWMKILSDVEYRVVMVIARQTYGWIEDKATGRRKEKDWISRSQLEQKTFRSKVSISGALKNLIDKIKIIEAYNEEGEMLDTPQRRRACGGKIFYRINTEQEQGSLFPTSSKFRQVKKKRGITHKKAIPVQSLNTQSLNTTKETVSTKETIILRTAKAPSAHKQFIDFWYKEVQLARGIAKPIITGKDGKNLKRIIDAGISTTTLEQAAVYFLNHYGFKKFAPSISTFLSAGVLNGLMNAMRNSETFWKELDGYVVRRGAIIQSRVGFAEQIEKMKANAFKISITDQERTEMSERVASAERAAR